MTPARWQQVETLFLAALKRHASERSAFLDQACEDPDLKHEVESLLLMHESSDPVLDKTVGAIAAKLMPPADDASLIGQSFGAYKIERLIGRGGMGEVYLARDAKLNRRVAIKLLPVSFKDDSDRVRRFKQEARATSSLNHPNIVTIHEIVEADGLHFIVVEYIEGTTLRELLRTGISLEKALDILIQTAGALSAAHIAGIVHRDIKPENIMVRHDGYVKVLDFGLAKLMERRDAEALSAEGSNISDLSTKPGTVMGTVKYMSPEQARGQKMDHRSDVFSLGVVLYESITGRAPFDGETPSHTIVSILEREPQPIADHLPGATEHLQSIIDKALRKDRDDRYQTVAEFRSDLNEARDELRIESVQRGHSSSSASGSRADTSGRVAITSEQSASADRQQEESKTSSADYIRSEIKKHKLSATIVTAVAIVVLAGFGFGVWELISRKLGGPSFDQLQFRKITTAGNLWSGAISPDGRLIAYIATDEHGRGIWVKQIATGNAVKAVDISSVELWSTTLSPDSNFVYYVTEDLVNRVGGTLYRVPTLGGMPEQLLTNITGASFSPDGKRFAFVRQADGEYQVLTADVDGGDERLIRHDSDQPQGLNWSCEGKGLLLLNRLRDSEGIYSKLTEIDVRTGAAKVIVQSLRAAIGSYVCLPDDKGLLLTITDDATGVSQIWHMSYPRGELKRITRDLINYGYLSITADGKTALTAQTDLRAVFWSFPMSAPDRVKQVAVAGAAETIAWAPDRKIVYSFTVNGEQMVWEMNADGSQPRQLLSNGKRCRYPLVTPDDRYILYCSNRPGGWQVWRADRNGRNPQKLTDGPMDSYPSATPDSRWVVYNSKQNNDWTIWKVGIDGQNPTRLAVNFAETTPVVSPDGKLIAFERVDPVTRRNQVVTMPIDGGNITTVCDSVFGGDYRWTIDGKGLVYTSRNDPGRNLWIQPITGGAPRKITSLADAVGWFDLSSDGRDIAFMTSHSATDLVLITNLN